MDRTREFDAGERRRHARVELLATAIWKDGRGAAVATFDVENISEGGLLVRSSVAIPEGQPLTVEVTLPAGFIPLGPRTLLLRGRVVRCTPAAAAEPGAGEALMHVAVAFIDLGDPEEEAIAKYVRRKSALGRL